jgi:hypothetical protein
MMMQPKTSAAEQAAGRARASAHTPPSAGTHKRFSVEPEPPEEVSRVVKKRRREAEASPGRPASSAVEPVTKKKRKQAASEMKSDAGATAKRARLLGEGVGSKKKLTPSGGGSSSVRGAAASPSIVGKHRLSLKLKKWLKERGSSHATGTSASPLAEAISHGPASEDVSGTKKRKPSPTAGAKTKSRNSHASVSGRVGHERAPDAIGVAPVGAGAAVSQKAIAMKPKKKKQQQKKEASP